MHHAFILLQERKKKAIYSTSKVSKGISALHLIVPEILVGVGP